MIKSMEFEDYVRLYRLYEAAAIYDLYYEQLSDAVPVGKKPFPECRPLTRVPIVFHCSTLEKLAIILAEEVIRPSLNGCVSSQTSKSTN